MHDSETTKVLLAPPCVEAERTEWLALAAVGSKVLLFLCLAHAVVYDSLPQYQDKAMGYRLVLYPALALFVPFVWGARFRRRDTPYPWLVDLCLVLPFLLDAAGNTVDLYSRVEWWDDVMHIATWVPLVAAFGFAVATRPVRRIELASLMVAFGAVAIIGWEVAEYLTFVSTHPIESLSAYRDTIGDMVGSLVGTALATWAVIAVVARQEVPERRPEVRT